MKKFELSFTFLLLPLDFVMLMLAAISAYHIRFAEITAEIRPVIFNLPFSDYAAIAVYISLLWLVIFAFAGLYKINGFVKIVNEAYRIVLACSTGFMAVIILMFFRRELFSSRFIILAAWILAIIYVVAARIAVRWLQRHLYSRGVGAHNIAVIGDMPITDKMIKIFSLNKALGYKVAKRYKHFNEEAEKELRGLIELKKIDDIIQIDPNLPKAEILKIINFCEENHITFKYAADLLGTKILKTDVNMIAGVPIVEIKNTPLDGWGRIAKRIFDIISSLFFIIILSPIIIATALLIKFESNGPIIYKNERVSKDGYFKTYKFRSMLIKYCVGQEYGNNDTALKYEKELIENQNTKEGPVYKIGNDPRLTKVGRFIRRWSIDEFPQFFNVLFGSMSLVGPRPHQPREVARYERHHKKVLAIKPGITGLAQISGRSDLTFEEEVKLDTYYIENWSLLLDISIILRTPIAMLRRRKAE
ncbi:MAG: sugar transferase [Patescibacteria group bacterium]|jgi:exopolysaccharide biosynthesis polyprenyl glycosylphosphotransferase